MKKLLHSITLSLFHFLTLSLLNFTSPDVTLAQTISVKQALQRAEAIKSASPLRGDQGGSTPTLAYTEADAVNTYFYVFNYPNGGFAIIGGDEAANDVLGYCDHGTFDADNMPPALREMLDNYRQNIATAKTSTLDRGNAMGSMVSRASSKVSIPRLMKTKWNQNYPYNSAIPFISDDKRFYTGCNATAVSQIIKYYSYAIPTGSNTYSKTLTVNGETYPFTFTANLNTTTYDFANMLDTYTSYTDQQAEAVGLLMYHVGVMMNMNYGLSGSGSISTGPRDVLKHFGYDATTVHCCSADGYTAAQWEDLIYEQLAQRHPVMYSGRTYDDKGHGFLIHGYDANTGMFAVNWGWGGHYDGYFQLTGTDALANGNGQYNLNNMATIGIQPGTTKLPVIFSIGTQNIIAERTTTIAPPAYYNGTVTYVTSDPLIATVDANGLVTAHHQGTVTIIATATAAQCYTATTTPFHITVTPKPADYNSNIVITEHNGTDDYTKKPRINNRGTESITITAITVIDKDDPENTYTPNISPYTLNPHHIVSWTLKLGAPMPHPKYEIHYLYHDNDCIITYDPDPSYNPTDGIQDITLPSASDGQPAARFYDTTGRRITQMRPGLNIIRTDAGKTIKVIHK